VPVLKGPSGEESKEGWGSGVGHHAVSEEGRGEPA
jgi:hypothetical protein